MPQLLHPLPVGVFLLDPCAVHPLELQPERIRLLAGLLTCCFIGVDRIVGPQVIEECVPGIPDLLAQGGIVGLQGLDFPAQLPRGADGARG